MKLLKQLRSLLKSRRFDAEVIKRYHSRLREGLLTRDENPESHFCVYFAAIDPVRKEVFIGHHKKRIFGSFPEVISIKEKRSKKQ